MDLRSHVDGGHAGQETDDAAPEMRRGFDTIRTELTWAWRGLRARRLAGILQVALVALTLAANAIVFSATDAFVFRRVPYPNADRLVILRDPHPQSMRGYQTGLTREEIDAWRRQRDVLAAVQAYEQDGTTYVSGPDGSEAEVTEVVTPGFFAMLGTPPRWGREFRDDEAAAGVPAVAIIASHWPVNCMATRLPRSATCCRQAEIHRVSSA